jgi:hypothetical protein
MKQFRLCILLAMAVLITAASYINNFHHLHKLEGTWRMKAKKGFLFESWQKVNDHELSSISFKVVDQDTIMLEKVSLVQNKEGIFYIPVAHGQNDEKPVSFKMISSTEKSFTFENKEHDFPTRIIYTFIKADSLVARIEGDVDGKLKAVDYFYMKVK